MTQDQQAAVNTDLEVWSAGFDYRDERVIITAGNGIGISLGGYVVVKTALAWHQCAAAQPAPPDLLAQECDDADAILTALGLEPDSYRTDGGRLNLPKIRAALEAPAASRAAEAVELTALIKEADDLLHVAKWAASKLNSEMNLRHSMPSWTELEALTGQRDAMRDWTTRARAALSASPQAPEPRDS